MPDLPLVPSHAELSSSDTAAPAGLSTGHDFHRSALATIRTEIAALELLAEQPAEPFQRACELLLNCQGRVVVSGMGKSGHIGRKIAATLASTGTPSFFMHPGEAAHGDLGMLVPGDVLIAISNSGESDEIRRLIPVVQYHQIPLITITRDSHSYMASVAQVALTLGRAPEACPLGLAPTSSTTATLVLGDALAVALLENREFTKDDFALSHPAGALGRRLLTRVSDVMHQGEELPIVRSGTRLREALMEMTSKRLGVTAIVDEQQHLLGIFTDGDLRRTLDQNFSMDMPIEQVMTKTPVTLPVNTSAAEALEFMELKKVNQLLMTDNEQRVIGVITLHDLIQAGVR